MTNIENEKEVVEALVETEETSEIQEDVSPKKRKSKLVVNIILFAILFAAAGRFWFQYQDAQQAQIVRENKTKEIRETIQAEIEKIEQGNILASPRTAVNDAVDEGAVIVSDGDETEASAWGDMPEPPKEEPVDLDLEPVSDLFSEEREENVIALDAVSEEPLIIEEESLPIETVENVEEIPASAPALVPVNEELQLSVEVVENVREDEGVENVIAESIEEAPLKQVKEAVEVVESVVKLEGKPEPKQEEVQVKEIEEKKVEKVKKPYNWYIKAILKKEAIIHSKIYGETRTVSKGSVLPILGRVDEIARDKVSGKWYIRAENGVIK